MVAQGALHVVGQLLPALAAPGDIGQQQGDRTAGEPAGRSGGRCAQGVGELGDERVGCWVAGRLEGALQPGLGQEAAPHCGLSQNLHRARLGRQGAALVALDRGAAHADLDAELGLDHRRRLALVGGNSVNGAAQQAAEGLALSAHACLLVVGRFVTPGV